MNPPKPQHGFTAADRLTLLTAYGVIVTLTWGGQLDVRGPKVVLRSAIPMLKKCKADIVAELKRQRELIS